MQEQVVATQRLSLLHLILRIRSVHHPFLRKWVLTTHNLHTWWRAQQVQQVWIRMNSRVISWIYSRGGHLMKNRIWNLTKAISQLILQMWLLKVRHHKKVQLICYHLSNKTISIKFPEVPRILMEAKQITIWWLTTKLRAVWVLNQISNLSLLTHNLQLNNSYMPIKFLRKVEILVATRLEAQSQNIRLLRAVTMSINSHPTQWVMVGLRSSILFNRPWVHSTRKLYQSPVTCFMRRDRAINQIWLQVQKLISSYHLPTSNSSSSKWRHKKWI